MTYFAVSLYLLAIVAANLSVAYFGPSSLVITAFLLIGLDLALRDYLHEAWEGSLWAKMGALILAGAAITYALNPGAGWVALASVLAFSAAMAADTWVYDLLAERVYLLRANTSNLAGATVDSVLFATVAFGFSWGVAWAILGQLAAKTAGGAVWSWVINRIGWHEIATAAALMLATTTLAGAQSLYVSAHYDAARGNPIVSINHDTPLPGPLFATGFVEAWRNPENGFPAEEWSLFSKQWVKYPLTGRLSASVGGEMLYNRAGASIQHPAEINFRPQDPKLHVLPKVGMTLKIY